MHYLIITVLFASAFCYHVELPNGVVDSSIDHRIFEDLINSTIEGLRPDLPDPLVVENYVLSLPDEPDAVVKGNASISNLNLSGLQGFQITALNLAIIGVRLNFTLLLPTIDFYTDYTLNLLLADTVALWGDGNITANFENLEIQGSAQANLTGGIQVENLRLQLAIGTAKFDIHGLLDDEELSHLLTSILNDLVVTLVDDNQELITQILSPIVENLINSILSNIGATTTVPPIESTTVAFN